MNVQVGLNNKGFAAQLANVLWGRRGVSVSQALVFIEISLSLKLFEANVALGTLHLVVGKVYVLFDRAFVGEQLAADLTRELGDLQVL